MDLYWDGYSGGMFNEYNEYNISENNKCSCDI